MSLPKIYSWIKTPCGRAKYAELAAQKGIFSGLRLGWFIVFAAIKDLNIRNPDQMEDSES